MAKLTRKKFIQFAKNAPLADVDKFGSVAAGSAITSLDPDVIQALAAWTTGWVDAVMGNKSPVLQDFNAVDYVFAYMLQSIFEEGVPDWETGTTYWIGSIVNVSGLLYVSQTNTNVGNDPASDYTNWHLLTQGVTTTVLTADGSFVAQSTSVLITAIGGGGGGGGGSNNGGGGAGGNSGAHGTILLPTVPGRTYNVVIGTGGAGGANNATVASAGANGLPTTVTDSVSGHVILSFTGGEGGGGSPGTNGGAPTAFAGNKGQGGHGNSNIGAGGTAGIPSGIAMATSQPAPGAGDNSKSGPGGSGMEYDANNGQGGLATTSTTGNNGNLYGAGGSGAGGSSATGNGGAGSKGLLVINQ
jgi:hypothetical protein